ncbi:MAG TPA: putative metal-dependent hydrolase, partial [Sphingobacteriaceae bacterium]
DLRYPAGRFSAPEVISPADIRVWISELERLPERLRAAVSGLSPRQLGTPYRPGGWTLRQVVHHLPDSHMNAYIRFKLALTEDNPVIRPYREDLWAETGEAREGDVLVSLDLLESLHRRWVRLLGTISPEGFRRTYYHPEAQQTYRLDTVLGLYAWHGTHHLAHITNTIRRQGW